MKLNEIAGQCRDVTATFRQSFFDWFPPNADGGFGRTRGTPSDSWSTAEAVLLSHRLGIAAEKRVADAVAYLLRTQHADGGWGASSSISDTTGTALSLLALHMQNSSEDITRAASRGLDWLAQNQNAGGGWPLVPSSAKEKVSTVFTTVHACLAVVIWYLSGIGDAAVVNEIATLAGNFLAQARHDDGSWGLTTGSYSTARHTAYVLLGTFDPRLITSTFNSSLATKSAANSALRWLRRHQHPDGSWGEAGAGDIEATAIAVQAFLSAGVGAEVNAVKAGVAYLLRQRKEDRSGLVHISGWTAGAESGMAIWPTYYAVQALIDFIQQYDKERQGKTRVALGRGRRVVLGAALAGICAAVAFAIYARALTAISAILTIGSAIASVIGAWPVAKTWIRRHGLR